MKGLTFSAFSSETASTTRPLGPRRRWNSSRSGISLRQGGHQVAQKFTSTTLPRRPLRVHSRPARSFRPEIGRGATAVLGLQQRLGGFVGRRIQADGDAFIALQLGQRLVGRIRRAVVIGLGCGGQGFGQRGGHLGEGLGAVIALSGQVGEARGEAHPGGAGGQAADHPGQLPGDVAALLIGDVAQVSNLLGQELLLPAEFGRGTGEESGNQSEDGETKHTPPM